MKLRLEIIFKMLLTVCNNFICSGVEDEICPYATFHLLGFREEMDPTKALNFQTFPHQNGQHVGTMGPNGPMPMPGHMHSRAGSQSMVSLRLSNFFAKLIRIFQQPRANRFARKNSQGGQSSIYSPAPEYDDPANYAPEEDQYRRCNPYGQSVGGSIYYGPEYDDPANCAAEEDQYCGEFELSLEILKVVLKFLQISTFTSAAGGPYGTPYDHYDSRGSIGRRSAGSIKNTQLSGSPEPPPPPPPRNHETSNSSFNDSKESNEISEAECDRDNGPRGNYGGRLGF